MSSKILSKESSKNGVIDQVKYRKWASTQKWTEQEYHVKEDNNMTQKGVKCSVIQTSFLH